MKLLIADDHTLFRDALVQYIERAEPDADVTTTKDFDKAFEILKEGHVFDLVILDLRMPGMNGMQGFQTLRTDFPETKVVLMSGVAESDDVRAAMDAGARGYFPKTMSGKGMIKAVRHVLSGETFVPMDPKSNEIMAAYHNDRKLKTGYKGISEDQEGFDGKEVGFNLTPREKDVLGFLAKGASNKEIANALGLQVVTVKLHVRGVCRKLDANNRTQAALKATQLGLVAGAN